MNPRRVHELMIANYPPVELVALEWLSVLEADGAIRREVLDGLIGKFIRADEMLVEVNRKLGDLKPRDQVIPFVQAHVGKGQIRIADRHFQD